MQPFAKVIKAFRRTQRYSESLSFLSEAFRNDKKMDYLYSVLLSQIQAK